MDAINYIFENREWLFSGAGITIIGGIITIFFKKKNNYNSKRDEYINNGNISGEGNIMNSNGNYIVNNIDKSSITQNYNHIETMSEETQIDELASKFFKIFEEHGVLRSQIPTFINHCNNIQLEDVKNETNLLKKLNEDIINRVSNTFGIERAWFDRKEGESSSYLYQSIDCYKYIYLFINLLKELRDELGEREWKHKLDVLFIKGFNEFSNNRNISDSNILIVLKVRIGTTTTENIFKYIFIRDNMPWNYWKSRHDLKCLMKVVISMNISSIGYTVAEEDYKKISSCKVVPKEILDKSININRWFIDDIFEYSDEEENEKYERQLEKVENMINLYLR